MFEIGICNRYDPTGQTHTFICVNILPRTAKPSLKAMHEFKLFIYRGLKKITQITENPLGFLISENIILCLKKYICAFVAFLMSMRLTCMIQYLKQYKRIKLSIFVGKL